MIEILKPLFYISPSSFMEWQLCPWKFYLKRLAGWRFNDPQSLPAGVGTAFDAFIKHWLAKRLKIEHRPTLNLNQMLKNITNDERDRVLEAGRNLAKFYVDRQFGDRLLNERVTDLEVEIYKFIGDIPLYGILDGVVNNIIPFDWKVRGYNAKKGYSPTPGYRVYVTSTGDVKAPHADERVKFLEDVNVRWAIQLSFYGWLLKLKRNHSLLPFRDMATAIDECTYGEHHIIFTQLRLPVSADFQEKLYEELKRMWLMIQKGDIPQASPDNERCFIFNKLCEAAHYCEAYKDINQGAFQLI